MPGIGGVQIHFTPVAKVTTGKAGQTVQCYHAAVVAGQKYFMTAAVNFSYRHILPVSDGLLHDASGSVWAALARMGN